MFLIDDFGRQKFSPTELLNRWIVPMENQIDYLRLNSGTTFLTAVRRTAGVFDEPASRPT